MADFSLDYRIHHDDARLSCSISFKCFDTPNAVTVFGCEPAAAEQLLVEVRNECLRLHRLWSFSAADSDIARINECVREVDVDPSTAELIEAMIAFHAHEPLFDFTIGPVSLAWKKATSVPTDEELAAAMAHVGVSNIHVEGRTVLKDDPLARIDVGGAAKGFAADRIAAQLREAGVLSADIDLGGNLFLLGDHPEGRPWRMAVRIPEGVPAERVMVNVSDKSAVTSGSYERFVEIDGKRYQHIVDPRTGWPSESDIVSATVIAARSLEADMLATTTCLAGTRGFFELAARHLDCDFIAILADGTVLRSA